MLLISIVDRSEQDAARLHSILEDYFRRTGTAYAERVYRSGMDFVRSSENSDIVFMDIQLDRLDGLETARIMRKLGSDAQLIFITRLAELAIKGYAVDALDFLLKPAEPAQVCVALDKAIQRLENRSSTFLALKLPNGTASVCANDITYVEVFDHNLVYHTVNGDYSERGRLADVYAKLDHNRFIACNRSFIVNLRYVTEIRSDHVMLGDTKVTVSKSHRKEIQTRFSAYMDKKTPVRS